MNILVLCGGGSSACYTAGFLYESFDKIKFDKIYGTSSGALNSILLAKCYYDNNREFLKQIWTQTIKKNSDIYSKNYLKFFWGSFPYSFKPLRKLMDKEIGDLSFLKNINTEIITTTVDLISGRILYMSSKDLTSDDFKLIVQASANIPVLFKPIKYGDYLLVDGGIRDNLPVRKIKEDIKEEECNNVILVVPDIIDVSTQDNNFDDPLSCAQRTVSIMLAENMVDDFNNATSIDCLIKEARCLNVNIPWIDNKKILNIIPIFPSETIIQDTLDFTQEKLIEGFNKGIEKAKEVLG